MGDVYRIKPLQWEMSSAYDIRSASAMTFYGFYTVITEILNGAPTGKYTGYAPRSTGDAEKFTRASFDECLRECDSYHILNMKKCLEPADISG